MSDCKFDDNVTLISKEIALVKLLSSNNSAERKKGISGLKKWLKSTSNLELPNEHYNRIWKGLFYYYWMSDTPLVQEASAERISGLIDCATTSAAAMKFVKGFFVMLTENFNSISHHRAEKFLLFVRRFLRHSLFWLKNRHWDELLLAKFGEEIYHAQQILPFTLSSHLNDIFNEEVAKVSNGKLSTEQLISLLQGYVQCLVNLKPNMKSVDDIQRRIFVQLCKQLKFYVKSKFQTIESDPSSDDRKDEPTHEHIENCEANLLGNENDSSGEDDASDDEETPLDPRPGHVDVVLPFLDFDEKQFILFLERQRDNCPIALKAKNIVQQVINMLKSVSSVRRLCCKNPETLTTETVHATETTPKVNEIRNERPIVPLNQANNGASIKKTERCSLNELGDIIQIKKSGSGSRVLLKKLVVKDSKIDDQSHVIKDAPIKRKKSDSFTEENSGLVSSTDQSVATGKKRRKRRNSKRGIVAIVPSINQPIGETDNGETRDSNNDGCDSSSSDGVPKTAVYEPKTDDVFERTVEESTEHDDKKCSGSIPPTVVPLQSEKKCILSNDLEKELPTMVTCDSEQREPASSKILVKSETSTNENFGVAENSPIVSTCDRKEWPIPSSDIITKLQTSKHSDSAEIEENMPIVLTSNSQQWQPVSAEILTQLKDAVIKKGTMCTRSATGKKKRRVNFTLKNNSMQDFEEYEQTMQLNPDVPFDSEKKPEKSSIKPFVINTPVNPFYELRRVVQNSNVKKKKKQSLLKRPFLKNKNQLVKKKRRVPPKKEGGISNE